MGQPIEDQAQYRVSESEDVARRYAIEQTRMTLEAGWLGKIFGSAANAPTSIAGASPFLLILPLIFMIFVPSNIPPLEYLNLTQVAT